MYATQNRAYAGQKNETKRKLLNSFATIQGKNDGKGETWVEKLPVLFRCLTKAKSESKELAFLQYMECVPLLDKADDTPRTVCVQ